MLGVGGSGEAEKTALLEDEGSIISSHTTSKSWFKTGRSKCHTPKRRFRSCDKPAASQESNRQPSIFTRFYSNSPREVTNRTSASTIREGENSSPAPQTVPKKITKRQPAAANAEMQGRLDRLERMIEMLQQKHCRPKKEEPKELNDCDTPLPSIERDSDMEMDKDEKRSSTDGGQSDTSKRGKGHSWKEVVGIA